MRLLPEVIIEPTNLLRSGDACKVVSCSLRSNQRATGVLLSQYGYTIPKAVGNVQGVGGKKPSLDKSIWVRLCVFKSPSFKFSLVSVSNLSTRDNAFVMFVGTVLLMCDTSSGNSVFGKRNTSPCSKNCVLFCTHFRTVFAHQLSHAKLSNQFFDNVGCDGWDQIFISTAYKLYQIFNPL